MAISTVMKIARVRILVKTPDGSGWLAVGRAAFGSAKMVLRSSTWESDSMPLYEYKCAKCGDVFELIQKFSDEPLHEHPGCGGAVEKLLSAAALQFKGSGWYVNDYGRNGSGGKDSGDKDSGGKEKPKAESSDTKKSEKAEAPKPAATPSRETSSTTKSG